MKNSDVFEFVCAQLEQESDLDRLEARGTVRIALRLGGFEPRSIDTDEMVVIVNRLLPRELFNRGMADAESVCARISKDMEKLEPCISTETPAKVFSRLGRA